MSTEDMTESDAGRRLLDLPLPENDSGASTVRGYLAALLEALWREEQGFSGKRPFGNSSWQYDLYIPMARAGMLAVTVDDEGELECEWAEWGAERRHADELILAAIKVLGEPTP